MGSWALIIPTGTTSETISLADLSVEVVATKDGGGSALQIVAPGNRYQRTVVQPRQLVLRIMSNKRAAGLPGLRVRLGAALAAGRTATPEALTLRYTGAVRTLDLYVVYAGGLEDGPSDTITLRFVAHDPVWYATSETTEGLYTDDGISANYVIQRSTTGVWGALGAGPGGTVYALAYGPDGRLYAGGDVTGGVQVWNGTSWATLGTGMNGTVNALCWIGATLYAGGVFTTVGGVSALRVAAWNGTSWSALGGGLGTMVSALVRGADGTLYAAGAFTGRVAAWNGTAWTNLASGFSEAATCLAVGPDDRLYAGGHFSGYVAVYDGASWATVGGGMNGVVYGLAFDAAGRLYAAGAFTTAGSAAAARVAMYTSTWAAVGAGVNEEVFALVADPITSTIIVGGLLTAAGDVPLYERIAQWNGSVWLPLPFSAFWTTAPHALAVAADGRLAVGYDVAADVSIAGVTTVINAGSVAVAPVLVCVQGAAAVITLMNYTTGVALYAQVRAAGGETIRIDCRNGIVTGAVLLPGSRLTSFVLVPGANLIGLLGIELTSASLVRRHAYLSLESADVE